MNFDLIDNIFSDVLASKFKFGKLKHGSKLLTLFDLAYDEGTPEPEYLAKARALRSSTSEEFVAELQLEGLCPAGPSINLIPVQDVLTPEAMLVFVDGMKSLPYVVDHDVTAYVTGYFMFRGLRDSGLARIPDGLCFTQFSEGDKISKGPQFYDGWLYSTKKGLISREIGLEGGVEEDIIDGSLASRTMRMHKATAVPGSQLDRILPTSDSDVNLYAVRMSDGSFITVNFYTLEEKYSTVPSEEERQYIRSKFYRLSKKFNQEETK